MFDLPVVGIGRWAGEVFMDLFIYVNACVVYVVMYVVCVGGHRQMGWRGMYRCVYICKCMCCLCLCVCRVCVCVCGHRQMGWRGTVTLCLYVQMHVLFMFVCM